MMSMKVLIIDDSPDALARAKARLSKEGLEILCADGGRKGLSLARRHHPDVILLDVDMPDLPGFEVCRALKADPELRTIPVIFLSGSGSAQDKVKGLDLGAVDYVAKPFDAFELRARVRAALRTKRFQDLLVEQARIDPLTGLPNRRALEERLRQEWARAQRHGNNLAFVMGDLDHFKTVNDTHGHQAGDAVLQEVAARIRAQCRSSDLPARYGGEEFAVLVCDEPAWKARRLAERCREAVEQMQTCHRSGNLRVTMSFGVSDNAAAGSPAALVRLADRCLYRAKEGGRNRVECTSADPADAPRQVGR